MSTPVAPTARQPLEPTVSSTGVHNSSSSPCAEFQDGLTSCPFCCADTQFQSSNVCGHCVSVVIRSKAHVREVLLKGRQMEHQMKLQNYLAKFACAFLGFSSFVALFLFCAQGFSLWRFRLDTGLMHWLGVVTIGTLSGLMYVVYRSTFSKRR